MFFLDISATCGDPALATILNVVKKIFIVVEVAAPIVLIVMISVHLINMMSNPDDKKLPTKLKNSIMACVIIFFIPVIMNVVFYLLGDSSSFTACWNSSSGDFDSEYIEIDDGRKPLYDS